jgi:tetratricopeptide (TPR) repeat protein
LRRAPRWLLSLAGALALAAPLAQPACARQQAQEPPAATQEATADAAAWQQRLAEAERLAASAPEDVGVRRALVRLLLLLGRPADAEKAALTSASPQLANVLGEARYAGGEVAEAEQAFRRALAGNASDGLVARYNLALLLQRRGEEAASNAELERVAAAPLQGASSEQLVAVAGALRQLGRQDPDRFHDAVRVYEAAAAADPANAGAWLEEASLFLEKYQSTEAYDLIREVLQRQPGHPGALLLRARAREFDGSDEALALVRHALVVAPEHVGARVYHAELLLALEDYQGAAAEAERALGTNPASLEALTLLAATRRMAGDEGAFKAAGARALALNPRYSALYSTTAELAVQQRRYREASELAEQAVQLDSSNWAAWATLGLNQFRLGRVAEAKTTLERAFAGDPFNVWVKNTLDLLDTYPQYVERASSRARLFLHGSEADLLQLYMQPLVEEAIDSLARHYGYRPGGPVRIEVFPRHGDFSVRTVGLTGVPALGVSFGEQLVLDSPAARDPGEFNWGSTLWHEVAHTFTLGASRNRVPRWLTEGLSVYEERRARRGWGAQLTPSFVEAYLTGKTLPVSRLNEGFVRPQYPEQVEHSYYQASLVVEYIVQEHGFDAIRRMLRAYGDGRSNEQVIRDVVKRQPAELDAAFDAWLKQRFRKQLDALRGGTGEPGAYRRALVDARRLLEAGDVAGARKRLEEARDAVPEVAVPGSPYHLLADLYEAAGDRASAATQLEQAFARFDSDYQAMLRASRLRLALGDTARAASALERAIYVHPYDASLHQLLAQLYGSLDRRPQAVRERRAVIALKPVDMADARYQLALALERASERAEARAEVLRALELAPNFAAAQELLLRLSGGDS